jgi:threonine dehydrogenase-like Zn-dependent dehydrogenase
MRPRRFFGNPRYDGALADGTPFKLPVEEDDALMPSLLTLSDVMGTGPHAAVIAGAGPGRSVAVVGVGVEELPLDGLEGRIEPGKVLDRTVGLDVVPDGYRAMDEREAIKIMVRP